MVRAGGLRVLEMQAELDVRRRQIEDAQAENSRVKERLAREAGEAGGTAPCALNAADEVAVAAFLAGQIAFTAIAEVIAGTLETIDPRPVGHFQDLFECDARAREVAGGLVEAARATA